MGSVEYRKKFLELLIGTGKSSITTSELRVLCEQNEIKIPQWFRKSESIRLQRGVYRIPSSIEEFVFPVNDVPEDENDDLTDYEEVDFKVDTSAPIKRSHIQTLVTSLEEQGIVPEKYINYVPFGNFNDLKSIISSKKFYPVLITGPSGNGKSMSIEQVCAQLNREFICYSMTADTDEGDLLGGFVLINNEMVWKDGPVTVAARRGAVLCIDEIDYGAQNLSALQRVLEGKPFLLKKKGEIIHPKNGFQIIATANTKGKGSEDGRYIFTNVLNEAFLERFPITFEQEWPPESVEKKIIKKELEFAGKSDDEFANHLIMWASTIRKAFDGGAASEVISTRRLVHIAKAYPIFTSRIKAITYCLNRFDENTKKSFLDLYSKIDNTIASVNTPTEATVPETSVNS